jgi:hypothetical protein
MISLVFTVNHGVFPTIDVRNKDLNWVRVLLLMLTNLHTLHSLWSRTIRVVSNYFAICDCFITF